MNIGVADYGMSVWYGGSYDIGARLSDLKRVGYEGIEILKAADASDAIAKAVEFKRLGMDFTSCSGPSVDCTIQWTAAMGKAYVWTSVSGKDFDTFCRQVNGQAEAAARYGVKVGIHNHLGSLVETQAQLEEFLRRCPACGIVCDTGHLAAAGGDVLAVVKQYSARILAMHVKDWRSTGSASPVNNSDWYKCGYFTGLGKGNIGQNNAAVIKALRAGDYSGWVFVEHDTHKQDPLIDLSESRQYLKAAGV